MIDPGRFGVRDADAFRWRCPVCTGTLSFESHHARCSPCGLTFDRRSDVWDFLPPERAAGYADFLGQYDLVRQGERWGSAEGAYYRMLPRVAHGDSHRAIWRMRARSYHAFVKRVLVPMEASATEPLRIIDLGAGNGWLSYRLSCRGHRLAAVDLRCGERDGLGAQKHYDAGFVSVRAEFDRLPFADAQFDAAIFNASLHYSVDYNRTVTEALRILRPNGSIAVMDSPLYSDDEAGRRMVREREESFLSRFDLASNALPSEHYLTRARLARIASVTGIAWTVYRTQNGVRTTVRRLRAFLSGRRQPADFPILAAKKPATPLQLGLSNVRSRSSPPSDSGSRP